MKSLSEIMHSFRGKGRANTLDMAALKEAFDSLKNPHISFSHTSPIGATTISPANNWQKIVGGTALNNAPYLMSMPVENRAVYDGSSTRHFHVAITLSFYVGGTGQAGDTVRFALAKNGTEDLATLVEYTISGPGSGNVASTAIHGDYHMNAGDYLELWGSASRDGDEIDIVDYYFFAVGMFM